MAETTPHPPGGAAFAAADATPRLPTSVTCCLFDLDGVLTRTAELHASAWKQMFDEVLRQLRDRGAAGDLRPFDIDDDYRNLVDGRPRVDGILAFLGARRIELPAGPGSGPGPDIAGMAARKNALFGELLAARGVDVIAENAAFLRLARRSGRACAVVTSSANGAAVVAAAGLADDVDLLVDATTARERHLRGKPRPDTFAYAATALGRTPAQAAVFEDAVAGVAAGAAGGFAVVVGIGEGAHAADLAAAGATMVLPHLGGLGIGGS